MQSQKTYLNDLLKAVGTEDGAFDPQRNSSKTVFPTLVFRPFANPSPIETGRRRRVQAANRNGPVDANATPAKRKRANQDDADHRPAKEPVRRRCVTCLVTLKTCAELNATEEIRRPTRLCR